VLVRSQRTTGFLDRLASRTHTAVSSAFPPIFADHERSCVFPDLVNASRIHKFVPNTRIAAIPIAVDMVRCRPGVSENAGFIRSKCRAGETST